MRATPRALLMVLVPLALQGLAREVDHAVSVLLRSTLDLPDFVPQALSLVDPGRAFGRVAAWVAGGCAAWVALAAIHRRATGEPWADTLRAEAERFSFLLLRPALTLLALLSLAVRPDVPIRFHAPGCAHAGLGHRPGRGRAGGVPRVARPTRAPARARCCVSVVPRVPGLRVPVAAMGPRVGRASGQRAEDAAHGGGARPLVDARRRGRERAHGTAPDAFGLAQRGARDGDDRRRESRA